MFDNNRYITFNLILRKYDLKNHTACYRFIENKCLKCQIKISLKMYWPTSYF